LDAVGDVVGKELLITWQGPTNYEPSHLQAFRESRLQAIQRQLSDLTTNINQFNANLEREVREAVSKRREELRRDRETEEALGIEVRSRPDPSPVLNIPIENRKSIRLVEGAPDAHETDRIPSISDSDYERILGALRSFGIATERFPNTFGTMGEEVLREILLVILNNQFGPVGGELFSRNGKTDIAILGKGAPVFIAECKIWRGPSEFDEAIDQLLSYLTWRDGRAAIVLFVKNRDVTAALEKAYQRLISHRQCLGEVAPMGEARIWRFHQEGDTDKRLSVALVDVPVPQPEVS